MSEEKSYNEIIPDDQTIAEESGPEEEDGPWAKGWDERANNSTDPVLIEDINETTEPNYIVTHSFYIAGVQHHRMREVIDKLMIYEKLKLVPQPTNVYDPNAVKIIYEDFDENELPTLTEDIMLGYVPKKHSSEVAAKLEAGKILSCIIVELNPQSKPWEWCKVEIRQLKE